LTGEVGGSAAALRAERPDDAWRQRLLRPRPRLVEGRLAGAQGIRVAVDVSDGLFADAARLLGTAPGTASGLVLDAGDIPVAAGVRQAWADAWLEVAGGGEDYELLLGGPPELVAAAVAAIGAVGGEVRVVGRFDAGDGVRVLVDGVERPAPGVGHQHFG
jgi:thiamine-monophosphate kinase